MRWTAVTRLLPLSVIVVFAACSDQVTEPEVTVDPPQFAKVSDAPPASNHIVVFRGQNVPAGFADDVADAGGTLEGAYPEVGVAIVSGLDDRGARALQGGEVAFVELEPMLTLEEPAQGGLNSSDPAAHPEGDPSTAAWYSWQWNMHAIDAAGAWNSGIHGNGTTVAIIDTGIDYLHNELVGRVDLARSASFVPFDDGLVAAFFPARHPVTDLHYHGTHVASTVSTRGNAIGSVAPGATLMGVKVCSVFGSCSGSAIFAGIMHAVANGADVANMSLGGSFTKKSFPGFVSAIQRLFNYANRAGVTMVVSAGNAAADLDHDGNGFKTYCNAANVVCVSATGPTSGGTFSPGPHLNPDTPASYTNYGRSAISVAAPGGNVTGVIGACSTTSLQIPICQTHAFWYLGLRGTSMASPHTTGVAALIHQQVGGNPGLIRQRLHQSADDLGQKGTDPFYGKGRINAGSATGN